MPFSYLSVVLCCLSLSCRKSSVAPCCLSCCKPSVAPNVVCAVQYRLFVCHRLQNKRGKFEKSRIAASQNPSQSSKSIRYHSKNLQMTKSNQRKLNSPKAEQTSSSSRYDTTTYNRWQSQIKQKPNIPKTEQPSSPSRYDATCNLQTAKSNQRKPNSPKAEQSSSQSRYDATCNLQMTKSNQKSNQSDTTRHTHTQSPRS